MDTVMEIDREDNLTEVARQYRKRSFWFEST